MRKICFVTGTRAEYGLLSRLMRLVKEDKDLRLQVIATNMHLMPEYGETYKEIEKDGFTIDKKVYMHKPSDDAYGIISSMAEEMQGMNDALSELKPDILVLLGDRYEILVAAQIALIHRIYCKLLVFYGCKGTVKMNGNQSLHVVILKFDGVT